MEPDDLAAFARVAEDVELVVPGLAESLVQLALQTAGQDGPRDTYMQEKALGRPVALGDIRRGDLLFWKGHVAIARDAETMIHANAHHMMVAIEKTADAIARIKATGSDVTSVKRL